MILKRLLAYSAAGLAVVSLMAGAFFAGSHWGAATPISEHTLARWSDDLASQDEQLAAIRQQVDDQVATLATRVGQMQAQLLRLDALGKHLTEVGKLKRGEFDFDQPPPAGGPDGPPRAGDPTPR